MEFFSAERLAGDLATGAAVWRCLVAGADQRFPSSTASTGQMMLWSNLPTYVCARVCVCVCTSVVYYNLH